MDESEDNISSEDLKSTDSSINVKSKAKKRSLIERELETNLTARVTSPVTNNSRNNTSRYGRARRSKSQTEHLNEKKTNTEINSSLVEKSPVKAPSQSPVYKMHASNTPQKRIESPKKVVEKFLDNQIESIYQENKSLSRFNNEEVSSVTPSPSKKYPKVYIRKDLIQKREPEDTVMVIQNMFSPVNSVKKSSNTHLNNILERSCERYSLNDKQQNGYIDNSSVVKALDFDGNKKKNNFKDNKLAPSKNELFELEAKCVYQVGDLVWARMGTYPFWPSIVTRDPYNGLFVKKKLFGRIERDVLHVTFFGDNGRRSWIVDNMLREYLGKSEFESTREKFTPQDKKKDPRLYAAYFISEKKLALWNTSVDEAEILLKEPKRFRIDIFNDMLIKSRSNKLKQPKSKMSRTDSDVSLSESLYDSLFSEDDGKPDSNDKSKNRSRNKSLDMFEVVTACLDNMAAKTGITKIQRQSHMDIWLQKAKSKTPEKTKSQMPIKKVEEKKESKISTVTEEKKNAPAKQAVHKRYSLRRTVKVPESRSESQDDGPIVQNREQIIQIPSEDANGLGIIIKVESLAEKAEESMDCSIERIATCESETFTDESLNTSNIIDNSKNNTTHKTMSELENSNVDHNSQDLNKNNLESNNESKDLESFNKIKVSEESAISIKSNADLDVNIICESLEKNEDQDLEKHNSDNDKVKSGSNADITDSSNIQDPTNENYNTSVNSPKDLVLENQIDIDMEIPDKEQKLEAIPNMGFRHRLSDALDLKNQKSNDLQGLSDALDSKNLKSNDLQGLSDALDSKNQKGNDLQEHLNVTCNIIDKFTDDVDIISDTKKIKNQNLTINDNISIKTDNIKEHESNTEKYEENFESSTPKGKVNCITILQDYITNRGGEYDVDNMSVDEDSDSERLPYSPLSNLGNNSDDNLSLDDVPFVDGNEIGSQNPASENVTLDDDLNLGNNKITSEENFNNNDLKVENHSKIEKTNVTLDVDLNLGNNKITSEENFNNNDLKVENHSIIEKTKDEPIKAIEESKEVNGEIEHVKNTIENIDNKPEEIAKVVPDTIKNYKNELSTVTEKAKNKKKLCNGYKGENVREVNLRTKEVRIYVSDCSQAAITENGFHNPNKDRNVETTLQRSPQSDCSVVLSKPDNKRMLRSQKENKQEDSLNNPEFLKYMELRQDAILDENPEISEKDITAYMYKTWLYEQNVKSEVIKHDELRECNLVKGLNQSQSNLPPRKKNLSLKKNQSSISHTGTLKMFLRRTKDVSKHNYNDEICNNKRGVKKNMIKDDDDDEVDDCSAKKTEWHILPIKEHNDIALSISDSEKCKNINEVSNLANGDIKEGLEEDSTGIDKNITTEIKEAVAMQSNKKESEDLTHNAAKKQDNIDLTDSSVIVPLKVSKDKMTLKDIIDADSLDSEDSEAPMIKCKLRSRVKPDYQDDNIHKKIKVEDGDVISVNSEDSEISVTKRKKKLGNKKVENALGDPAFVKYLELRQDAVVDEHPELTHDDIVSYLYQTWLYEENIKPEIKKTDEIEQSTMVKGLEEPVQPPKKQRRKIPKTEKSETEDDSPSKPKRKSVKPFYNEEYSDIEEELEVYEIFKPRNIKPEAESSTPSEPFQKEVEVYNEVELYFAELTKPKPNIFKGLLREKVCEICEKIGSLVKCKGCNGMFHVDCVKKKKDTVEVSLPTPKGRKKKKKLVQRNKNSEELDNDQDISEENNVSIEELLESSHTVDADLFESQLTAKMKEILNEEKIEYDSYSSDDGIDWNDTIPGRCEIIDVKLKPRSSITENDGSDFKCNDCQKYDAPVCFVCKGPISNKNSTKRQNCNVAHCHKYYHLECLEHWPQTQFNGGEPSKNNKKFNEHFEAFTCPRHVCHTCVSDDPRGCKTRFSGDKLARCVRCPATYHSFTKCLPAGSQILTGSHILCPRHHENRPGKAPCHVNTGWCFICALGGSLICCEYCPTSFHAECLNIDPPEGGYMCEDCETGRLPLYGEMVWVKLGHYRWWPGIILHPYEIPENLLTVKHSPGEFVVRFFGQYDHYWVNRGRVFPFQEGDSGRISTNKSKIDAAFITAVEHAQRACEILKTAQQNQEESLDIASSLLPPHYVKLKVNKPCGSLCGRKLENPESSLTQCECNPHDEDPCGPYSQCLNRMLLTECGPACRAGDRCNNRAFEKRLYPKLVPYRTPSRGWGLKTLEDIKAGQFVIEYVGELIDEEETRRRMRRKHEMRDENFYFLTLDKERMIDAGPKGNLARFMNHCCEPNCETQKWTVLGDVRVGLFALYDIPSQSEVTFNYNLECAGIDKKRCMCGAKRCSGYIGAKPKQEESQPKKNRMHPGKRTYKKRKPEESPSTKNKSKRPIGRPPKPKELTEIEKDLLIIRNATNGISSDESSRSISSEFDRHPKALKRKRVSFSSEQNVSNDATASPDVKKTKLMDKLEGD